MNYAIEEYLVEMLNELITDSDTKAYLRQEYQIIEQCVRAGAEQLFKNCYYRKEKENE